MDKREKNFENFAHNNSNLFAYKMSLEISNNENITYMYLYSNNGMGKTHLLEAIEKFTSKNVLYVTSDNFISDYSNYCMNEYDDFYDTYYDVDILLLDDIQFLEVGKKSQIEFYKLLEHFIHKGKQVVITADRNPSDLNLFERLINLLQSGIIVNIFDYTNEENKELLKKILNKNQYVVNDEVINFICDKCNVNVSISTLKGLYKSLYYYCESHDIDFCIENINTYLDEIICNSSC